MLVFSGNGRIVIDKVSGDMFDLRASDTARILLSSDAEIADSLEAATEAVSKIKGEKKGRKR